VRKTLSFAVICRVIANLCGVVTAFVSIRLYNLYVTKEIYGTILVGLQIIGYLQLMSGGFRIALNQQTLAEPGADQKQAIARFGQTLQSYFFVFVVLAGMVGMAAYGELPKSRALDIPLLVFVSTGVAAAITFQAGSQLALLVAFGEQAISSLIQGAWGVLTVAVLWISFALGSGIWAFPISSGVGALLTILLVRIGLISTKNHVPLFVWKRESDFLARFRSVWRAAFDSLYNQVGSVLIFTLDLVFIGLLLGGGAATLYGVVTRVMGISRQVLQSLSEAAWPRLAQEVDLQRKAQIMRKVDRLNSWIVGSWFGAMAPTLLPFLGWLAPGWVAAPLLAGLIMFRHFIVAVMSPHAYGLLSEGQFRSLARMSWQEVVLGVAAGVPLTLALATNGTALAYLMASCGVTAWQLTRAYFNLVQDRAWFSEWLGVVGRALAAALASGLIATGLMTLAKSQVHAHGWLGILVGGLAFAPPVGIVLFCWRKYGKIP
jgi:O-antigen/teichoic acid export membrane protein